MLREGPPDTVTLEQGWKAEETPCERGRLERISHRGHGLCGERHKVKSLACSRDLSKLRVVGAKGSQCEGEGGPGGKMIVGGGHVKPSKKLGFHPQGKWSLT